MNQSKLIKIDYKFITLKRYNILLLIKGLKFPNKLSKGALLSLL